jgi:Glycosyl transferases group 1
MKPILQHLRSEFRYRVQYPTRYRLGLMKSGLGRMLNPKAETIRFLIVSDGFADTSEQQFAPLRHHEAAIRNKLGVVFQFMRLAEGMQLSPSSLARFHAVGLKLGFRTPDEEASRIARHFRDGAAQSGGKLVYFDGDDDVCVQWLEVLRAVDLYVKKHLFADTGEYLRSFIGKTNLTDYVSRKYEISFENMDIPRTASLELAQLAKLHLGWSTALDDKHADLFKEIERPSPSTKDVDILCRASLPQDWSFSLRNALVSQLEPLRDRYRVLMSLPTNRVPREEYYSELRRSRICVSPFGYGEACGRDVEAIICGCLLVKPDMSHHRTYPNIFVPGETYVSVRWDYTDLAETCGRYLDQETERARIADNAYRVLADSYHDDSFTRAFAGLLGRLRLMRGQPL